MGPTGGYSGPLIGGIGGIGFGGWSGTIGSQSYDFDPYIKSVLANILTSVGYGDYEQGVYDTSQPSVPEVFTGPSIEVAKGAWLPPEDSEPEFGGIYSPKAEQEDWDWVYEQYKILNPETEVEEVATVWDAVSGAIDIFQGQQVGGGIQPITYAAPQTVGGGTFSYPGVAPAKVTVDTKTGKVTACRRRRRRRLLTPTDLNDLAALKTIVGGGQAINFAVMKAVRR